VVSATEGEVATSSKRSAGPAGQAWTLMQQFVDSHSRHGDLAKALGFRLGAGRGKVLFQLRHGPMTLTQLAQANGVDAPYATLIVDKLEAHGLVERQLHPDDRRRKLVTLTSAGRDAIATADAILLRPPDAVSTLRPEELRQLLKLLQRLIEADQHDDMPRR
jgi:DNA-binding MarR family transcriptional regulator